MSREELINLVRKIQSGDGTEEELDKIDNILVQNLSDPNISDYIFSKEYEHLTAEEIVEKALLYRITLLPEGSKLLTG